MSSEKLASSPALAPAAQLWGLAVKVHKKVVLLKQGRRLCCCRVMFTPTVEHCSMATLIGLCIRTKLLRSLPPRFKVDIQVGAVCWLGCGARGEVCVGPNSTAASSWLAASPCKMVAQGAAACHPRRQRVSRAS